MAEGARLESVYTATYRGFESLPHRQIEKPTSGSVFFIWATGFPDTMEGENPRRVRAERLAVMNGQRPPRRGEPRSGKLSLPHRQIIKNRPQGRFFAFELLRPQNRGGKTDLHHSSPITLFLSPTCPHNPFPLHQGARRPGCPLAAMLAPASPHDPATRADTGGWARAG